MFGLTWADLQDGLILLRFLYQRKNGQVFLPGTFQCNKCIFFCRIWFIQLKPLRVKFTSPNTNANFNIFKSNDFYRSDSRWTVRGESICSSIIKFKLFMHLLDHLINDFCPSNRTMITISFDWPANQFWFCCAQLCLRIGNVCTTQKLFDCIA